MAYNPNSNQKQQPTSSNAQTSTNSKLSADDYNDYGHGLAEDQEVRFLYFKDRKNYTPFIINEPEIPEEATSFRNKIDDDEDDLPDFQEQDAFAQGNEPMYDIDYDLGSIQQDSWDNFNDAEYQSAPEDEIPSNFNNADAMENTPAPIEPQETVSTPTQNSEAETTKRTSKYDYVKLESVPLDFLLLHVGAKAVPNEKNLFDYYDQRFNIKDNRWYNQSFKYGDEGAISLCKNLMAIYERIDPIRNSKILGGKACKYLEGAYKDYMDTYKVAPPVFDKTPKNYTSKSNASTEGNKLDLSNPITYLKANYRKFNTEDKNIYYSVLDSLKFKEVSELFGAVAESDTLIKIKNEQQSTLSIELDGRMWSAQLDKKDKKIFGVGALSFASLLECHMTGIDYTNKTLSKPVRNDMAKKLAEVSTADLIDAKAFELEILEVDKTDPMYVFKLPYHRLDKSEREKYYTLIDNYPLERVATLLGATDNEDGQINKWKFADSFLNENIHIDAEGNRWNSWNGGGGGYGARSLVAYYNCLKDGQDFEDKKVRDHYRDQATNFILQHMEDVDLTLARNGNAKMEIFTLPIILEPKNAAVHDYLHQKRGLPSWIINKQMNSGYLFAGYPAHWKQIDKLRTPQFMPNDLVWAVFLTVSGQAAEMRGIARSDHHAKILAKGSVKHAGGFFTKAESKYLDYTVCSFEAAIDSLSYQAIYPGRHTQSCMGTEYRLAANAAADTLLYEGTKHSCCFDNDYAGIKASMLYLDELKELMKDEELEETLNAKKEKDPNFTFNPDVLYERFDTAFKEGRIGLFELTLKDFEESLKNNTPFYLDILEDKYGIGASRLFYKNAVKAFGKNVVDEAYKSGQFKYMNLLPSVATLEKDMSGTVSTLIDKLLSNHNYYLEMPDVLSVLSKEDDSFKNLNEEDKEKKVSKTKLLLKAFTDEFEKQAGENLKLLVESGSVVYSRKTYFKDWNEHLIYMTKTYPEFKQMLEDREKEFEHYKSPKAEKVSPLKRV